jgi:RNA polymerase sigma-70 factor (ECF subfamily)
VQQTKLEKFLLVRVRIFKDEDAFERLLREHSAALQRFLYGKLPCHADVEDAYSMLMMQLWEYATSTVVQHFSGLSFTIARRIVASFYHKREGKEQVPIRTSYGEEGVEVQSPNSKEQIEDHIDSVIVKEGLKKLESEDDREAVILRFIEGYSLKEIANYLGKTENATSALIHRALKKIRDKLEKK